MELSVPKYFKCNIGQNFYDLKKNFKGGTNYSKKAGQIPMTSFAMKAQIRQQHIKTFKQGIIVLENR